ncbi:hypothetical protein FY528_16310 [Hymenobacter lutimineralis]|uniref:Right handed beta helix domain-containing protein n=1 Tax=Hymenobacter lutimineralis TaxID=2606448 RepID=A0A5D6UVJ1_9BACT|nr:right-handed parallel beta-helix repeat-containing protein [Hymenobacter lutimineralis]TYZ07070.1 hypothetical protein FY528_16310 [Hymenobacter lutimineralis]
MKRNLFLLLIFLTSLTTASARGLYFAPWGNNANAGTKAAPWANFTTTNDWKIRQGGYDTLYFLGGTYAARFAGSISRADGQPMRLCAYPGQVPVLDGTTLGLGLQTGLLDLYGPTNISISGLRLQNSGGRGIALLDARNITIDNCTVREVRERAIGGSGDDVRILNCQVDRACLMNENQLNPDGSIRTGGWPVAVAPWRWSDGRPSARWTVRGTTIANSWGEGLSVQDTDGSVVEGNVIRNVFSVGLYANNCQNARFVGNQIILTDTLYRRRDTHRLPNGIAVAVEGRVTNQPARDLVFANNLVVGGSTSFKYWHSYAPGEAHNNDLPSNTYQNLTLAYNVFVRAENMAVVIDAVPAGFTAPSGSQFRNNVIDGLGTQPGLQVGNASAWSFSHNDWVDGTPTTGSHPASLAVVPQFVNPIGSTAADFRLTTTSPLGWAGTPLGVINTDFWGTLRSGTAPSIGLHEAPAAAAPAFVLARYSATDAKRSVQLSWATSSETGSAYFVVQRSFDGGATFSKLGQVTAAGTSTTLTSYAFTDKTTRQDGYYRLQMVDAGGKSTFSPVWTLNGCLCPPDPTRQAVQPSGVYPVPVAAAGYLHLAVPATEAYLYNAQGRVIRLLATPAGWQLPTSVAEGPYWLRARTASGWQRHQIVVAR